MNSSTDVVGTYPCPVCGQDVGPCVVTYVVTSNTQPYALKCCARCRDRMLAAAIDKTSGERKEAE